MELPERLAASSDPERLVQIDEANRRLLALAEVAFDGIVIAENGVIIDVSVNSVRDLGYEPEEILGRQTLELVAPQFLEVAIESHLMDHTVEPVEIGLIAKDGSTVMAEYFATNLTTRNGTLRVIGLRDIGRRLDTEREVATAVERERTRIGVDLHDQVGQLLIAAKWAAEQLHSSLGAAGPEAIDRCAQLKGLIDRAVRETRSVASRLTPPVVNAADMHSALKTLCTSVEATTAFACNLSSAEVLPLEGQDTAIHVYRIAEEAVTNAVRHSKGSRIDVSFERDGDMFALSIEDDGIGIDKETNAEGVGLRGMRYRSHLVGGHVHIDRRESGGTTLRCTFPA